MEHSPARSLGPVAALLAGVLLGLAGAASAARADVLELSDGRLVEGVVVRDGDVFLVHSRFGVTEVPAAQVVSHVAATPIDVQIQSHLATLAPDDTENRALLARWLREVGRDEEAAALAEAVVEVDPQNAVAHEVLGHVRHQGVWRTPDEARRAEGLEKHGDRWYTPEEWAQVRGEARTQALEVERQARLRALGEDVNRSVRLMLSPDARLRTKGRAHLVALATEYPDAGLTDLLGHVDAYVEQLEELRRREAAALAAGGGSGSGTVVAEIRATFSKLKRPIKTFETSLASNIGGAPVKIQLPELEVVRIRTVGAIPVVVR